jgi:hypothetical protein
VVREGRVGLRVIVRVCEVPQAIRDVAVAAPTVRLFPTDYDTMDIFIWIYMYVYNESMIVMRG